MLVLSLYVLFAPASGGSSPIAGADKVVHLALFALLAATTRWRFGRGLWAVVAYAVASELLQGLLMSTRSGDAYDVVADLLGVALGWLLADRLLRARAPDPARTPPG